MVTLKEFGRSFWVMIEKSVDFKLSRSSRILSQKAISLRVKNTGIKDFKIKFQEFAPELPIEKYGV